MKYGKLTGFLAGFLLIFTPPAALAAKKAIDAQEDHSIQLMKNPGLESGKADWTASSAPTFTLASSGSNLLTGKRSGVFNSSASGQTIDGPGVVVNSSLAPGLAARNWGFSCVLKGAATDYKIQAWDGTNVLAERVIPALSAAQRIGVTAPVTAGTTVRPRLRSQSDAADLAFDDCRVETEPTFDLAQAKLAVSSYFAGTASCDWTHGTAGSPTAFGADSDCPGPTIEASTVGTWSTTDTDLPQWTVTNLPAGIYAFNITAVMVQDGLVGNVMELCLYDASTPLACQQAITHGSAVGDYQNLTVQGSITYTDAQPSKTYHLRGTFNNGTLISLANEGNATRLVMHYTPLGTDVAKRFDTVAQSWSGYHGGDCYLPRTGNTFGDTDPDATCTFTTLSSTNVGSVTSALSGSDKIGGIVFTPNSAGKYRVKATVQTHTGNPAGTQLNQRLYDGTTVLAQNRITSPDINYDVVSVLEGDIVVSSVAAVTIKVQTSTDNVAYLNEIAGDGGSTPAISWSIVKLDQQQPAPVLLGSVGSASLATEYLQRLRVTNAGTPTIATQNGWVSSLTDLAVGDFEVNILASTFSSAPQCWCTSVNSGGAGGLCVINAAETSTVVRVRTTLAGVDTDMDVNVFCAGPH